MSILCGFRPGHGSRPSCAVPAHRHSRIDMEPRGSVTGRSGRTPRAKRAPKRRCRRAPWGSTQGQAYAALATVNRVLVSSVCGRFRVSGKADSPGYSERASCNRKIVAALLQVASRFRVPVVKMVTSRQQNLRNTINGFWRKRWDSNPRWACTHAGFQDRCLKPLGHPSSRRRSPYSAFERSGYRFASRKRVKTRF